MAGSASRSCDSWGRARAVAIAREECLAPRARRSPSRRGRFGDKAVARVALWWTLLLVSSRHPARITVHDAPSASRRLAVHCALALLIAGVRFVSSKPSLSRSPWWSCVRPVTSRDRRADPSHAHPRVTSMRSPSYTAWLGTCRDVLGYRIRSVSAGPCLVPLRDRARLAAAVVAPERIRRRDVRGDLCCLGGGCAGIINFLALRQAVTPAPLLGRMTSTMRWLILIPAGPGALLGGWLGEHYGLRVPLAVAGGSALLLAGLASRWATIREVRELPSPDDAHAEWLGGEAAVRPRAVMDAT